MSDEEGGEVQRMANLVGSIPWPRTMAATMTPGQVLAVATRLGQSMRANGVTMDLAPVLDLASGPGPDATHTDGPRSFSAVPSVAQAYGLAFAQGLIAGGVVPVVKHFPGEGSASANTDDSSASTPELPILQTADLVPFAAAISTGLPAIMVGNATIPGLSTEPASLSSSVITGYLREQMGFHGLVITDSLSAGAITSLGISLSTAVVDAVRAGADMVLFSAPGPDDHPDTVQGATSAIVAALESAVASGTITMDRLNGAVEDVLTAKGLHPCSPG
jgi:beta-N-acetylhexosaminidase